MLVVPLLLIVFLNLADSYYYHDYHDYHDLDHWDHGHHGHDYDHDWHHDDHGSHENDYHDKDEDHDQTIKPEDSKKFLKLVQFNKHKNLGMGECQGPADKTPKLKVGKTLVVYGTPPQGASRFSVNILTKNKKNIPLHFDVRLSQGSIIRNSLFDDSWGKEESHNISSEIKIGKMFSLEIKVENSGYTVKINGRSFKNYKHRKNSKKNLDSFSVCGDLDIKGVLIR